MNQLYQHISAFLSDVDDPAKAQHSRLPVPGIEPKPNDETYNTPITLHHSRPSSFFPQSSNTSTLRSFYTASTGPSPNPSLRSYYTAASAWSFHSSRTSHSSQSHSTSISTLSSNTSFSYSVTSINSRKSRKNNLYPRRAHPPPVSASLGSEDASIKSMALISQVRFFSTTSLKDAETRLVPAGEVILQSLDHHGYFSQRVPVLSDEISCCSKLFIALTNEVLLKNAVGARELEGPCKLLHATFKEILSKPGDVSPNAPELIEIRQKIPIAGALAPHQLASMHLTLCSVLCIFEGALHTINPTTSNAEAPGARMALLEFLSSTGLTLKTYYKELCQNLTETLAKSKSVQSKEHSFASVTPMLRPHKRLPQSFSMIEEVSELESEGGVGNGSMQSHSAQIDSDKTGKTVSYPHRAYPTPSVVAQPVSPEPEYVVSLEVLTWEVRYLCTSLLPNVESRLEPAGMLLVQSFYPQGDLIHPASVRAKEEFRYCSEVFIVLTREVILKDAVGTIELNDPCKLLLEAFRDILFKSKGFSLNLDAMGLQSLTVAVELIHLATLLGALCTVMDTFKGALNAIKLPAISDGDFHDHGRQVLRKLSISTGLTIDQYRKVLSQKLTQTQAQLKSHPI